jgi:ATP synthase protein I
VAGIAVWGGVGFLVDRLVWSRLVFTGIGIVLGAAAGIYIVYLRHGRGQP